MKKYFVRFVVALAIAFVYSAGAHAQCSAYSNSQVYGHVETCTAGSAVNQGQIVSLNASNQVVPIAANATTGAFGVAIQFGSTGAQVLIVVSGQATVSTDFGCAVGNIVEVGGSAGNAHCVASGPTTQVIGIATSAASTAGSVTVQIGPLTSQGTSSGSSSNVPVLINQTLDAFNRTGANLGANWTAYLNNFNVTPGSVQGNTVTVLNVAAYTGVPTSPTQTSRVSIGSLNAGTDFPGAAVRISGTIGTSVSYYVCDETTTTLLLQKVTGASNASAGTVATLTSTAITGVAGDYIALSVVGNTLTCTRNSSSSILEYNDSSSPLTTGAPGISIGGHVATIANFTLVNVGALAGASKNIVFDGDSIIAANGNGSGNTDPATSFLYLSDAVTYVTNLGVSSKCVGITAAAPGGGNIESMITTGTSVVDTLFVPGIKNIVVIFGGTNDLFFGQTPAQTYTSLTTYIVARQAAGWKVIVVPVLSRTATTTPALDAKESILTSLILANSAGADAVVNLPNSLITPGASANTNLFNSDQTHPTEITHIDIFARAFIAALSRF